MTKRDFAFRSFTLPSNVDALRAFARCVWANYVRLTALGLSAFFVVLGLDLLVPFEIPLSELLCGLVVENAASVLAAVFVTITLPAVFQANREG